MNHHYAPWNDNFFSKLRRCRFRRWQRYRLRLFLFFILGFLLWMCLDFIAIFILNPSSPYSLLLLLIHASSTAAIGLVLTHITNQLYTWLCSRFNLLRAFSGSEIKFDKD